MSMMKKPVSCLFTAIVFLSALCITADAAIGNCIPNLVRLETPCQIDDKMTIYYNNTNNCNLQASQGSGSINNNVLDVVDSFHSPGNSPYGLTYDGDYLWVNNNPTATIYKIDKSGNIIASFASPDFNPSGLAWDGAYLWYTSNQVRMVYKLDTSGNVLYSFPAPAGTLPEGLAWHDSYLWLLADKDTCNHGCTAIYKLNSTTGDVISTSFPPGYPSARYMGFIKDDSGHFWFTEFNTGTVYETNISGNLITSFKSPDSSPTGLAWDGAYLWISGTDSGGMIYKIFVGAANRTQSCDYCTPNWVGVSTECMPTSNLTIGYTDTNGCFALTGLASDNNPPANKTYACVYHDFRAEDSSTFYWVVILLIILAFIVLLNIKSKQNKSKQKRYTK